MSPDKFIVEKAKSAVAALFSADLPDSSFQVQVTRKEFEGDYTLVVFPLLKTSKLSPEATGQAIGEWLKANTDQIAGYNTVKGFLNLSFSNSYWSGLFSFQIPIPKKPPESRHACF